MNKISNLFLFRTGWSKRKVKQMKLTKKYYRTLNKENLILNNNPVFLESKNGDLSTFKYLHGGIDFSKKENRLARGLTLDRHKGVVLVGFEKFFLNNQLDSYEFYNEQFKNEFAKVNPYNELGKEDEVELLEKLDGTMCILGVYQDDLICGTSSSTLSEHATQFTNHFRNLENKQEIIEYLKEKNVCMIFEWISKFNLIAVHYETESEFVLLAEVNKDTFEVKLSNEVENKFNFRLPKIEKIKIKDLDSLTQKEHIEGYVVRNKYNHLVKIKTDWWFKEHFNNTVFLSNKKISKKDVDFIIESILKDEIDDLYSLQNSNEFWKANDKIGKIHREIQFILNEAQTLALKYNSAKDLAMNEKGHKFQGFALDIKNGKNPITNISFKRFIYESLNEKGLTTKETA